VIALIATLKIGEREKNTEKEKERTKENRNNVRKQFSLQSYK